MSEYDGCYVMVRHNPAFWLVEDGERMLMKSPAEVRAHGLRRVVAVSAEELKAIPVKGKRRKLPKAVED